MSEPVSTKVELICPTGESVFEAGQIVDVDDIGHADTPHLDQCRLCSGYDQIPLRSETTRWVQQLK